MGIPTQSIIFTSGPDSDFPGPLNALGIVRWVPRELNFSDEGAMIVEHSSAGKTPVDDIPASLRVKGDAFSCIFDSAQPRAT
eukprot:9478015-Pyramimonas_sp.AAC.1